MRVERFGGGPHWTPELEGARLRLGGLELDLQELAAPYAVRVTVYARGQEATLDPTDWVGAEVIVPPVRETLRIEGEERDEDENLVSPGATLVEREPLRTELVEVRLFSLPSVGEGNAYEGGAE